MEVTETLSEGLKREFKVVVSAAQLEQQMLARLGELKSTANIRGFRKGKVPIAHLRKLYGKSVMAEVVQRAVEETSQQAIAEKEVKPAYQPEIGMTEDEEEKFAVIEADIDAADQALAEDPPERPGCAACQDKNGDALHRLR
jgi:trigger factor